MANKVANTKKYELYKNQKRREKNKIKKLRRYLQENPNNIVAHQRLQELQKVVGLT